MRWVTLILAALLVLVHAELWVGKSGMRNVLLLRSQLQTQTQANASAKLRNDRLRAEVSDLAEGEEMVEEKARAELGMVRPNEILVQISQRR